MKHFNETVNFGSVASLVKP